jgi:hypothetical protein
LLVIPEINIPLWPPYGKDLFEIVHSKAMEIIQTHEPPPLPDDASDKIEEILKEADKALRDKE